MTEPTEWALLTSEMLRRAPLHPRGHYYQVALILDAARRKGIEDAAASHEHSGGNPAFRKMEADAIRALTDKGP